jgi:hypothetical protein
MIDNVDLEKQYNTMPIRSKKVYEANLILCSHNVEELRTIIDSVVDYDCFLVNRDQTYDGSNSELILEIAAQKSDWVEVFGYNAEAIHDAIDNASVGSKRQAVVGSGVPMTSWNDYESTKDVVDYIRTGGHGVSDTKLLIFVGTDEEKQIFWNNLDHDDA